MKLADTIKHQIEGKVCPIHDVHPVVDATGEEINVACCCAYFQKYCAIEIEYLKSQFKALSSPVNGAHIINRLNIL